MQNIGKPGDKITDIRLDDFLKAQEYNIKNVVRNVLAEEITPRLDTLEGKFDTLEGKFDTLEGKFDTLEGKFDTLEGKFDTLEGKVEETKAASATAHKEIIDRLERLENK